MEIRSDGTVSALLRDDGSFDPAGTATRAEMCAVIARLMEKTKETGSDTDDDTGEDQPLG